MNALYLSEGTLALALLTFLVNFFLTPSKQERAALKQENDLLKLRVAKNESDLAHHEQRFLGFSVQMERQADKHEERCGKLESELSKMARISEDLAVVKAKQDAQFESMTEIKGTLNKMFELLRTPSKN